MDLVKVIKERFSDRLEPSTFHSRFFWKTAESLARSPLNRPRWKADRVSLSYFLAITRDAYLGLGPVVWCNLFVPSELVLGLGCIPFYPEMATALVAAAGMGPRFIDRAAEAGFSPDACSFHRCALGLALEGFMPEPAMLLAVSYPCDSAPLSFAFCADLYGRPQATIDIPLPGRPGGQSLLAGQLEEVAGRLADFSGRKGAEIERGLAKALERSNQALHYLHEVEEMRKRDDCTLDGVDAMGGISVLFASMGSQAGADFYRLLAKELRTRGCAGGDSTRLMWMHLKPWFAQGIFSTLERCGARLVCEEYTHATWGPMDPHDPYNSLATKLGNHFLVGPVERRASHLASLAEEYRVDGAIHFNHWGCRQSCGGAALVKQALQAKGIPTLILDGDCVDEREYQQGQVSTRLEAFLESLSSRARW
jgi:benzoyl-CoA reductase/2-hydroxyglutaryl-CoA dehydratase subunit BcrC/BadD/HgdB